MRLTAVSVHASYNGDFGIEIKKSRNFTQFLFTRATDFCCAVLCDVHFEVIWITVSYLSLLLPFKFVNYVLPKTSIFGKIIFILTSWALNLVSVYTSTSLLCLRSAA